MPAWLIAALGVGGVGLLAWARSWWRGREVARQLIQATARADRAELERDAAAGAAAVADVRTEVIAAHVERQEQAADTAQEIRDAVQAADDPADPDAALRAAEQWVRSRYDRGAGADAGGGGAAAVRPPPAPKAR